MSTKVSIKYERNEGGEGWFHLYRECMDEDAYVYLELGGVHFEASTSDSLSGNGLNHVAVRLPNEWAIKLGLVGDQSKVEPK